MNKIIAGVDGMMCEMCEAHMKEAVKKEYNAIKAEASHTDKHLEFLTEADVTEEALAAIVKKAGYELTSFSTEPYEKKGLFW